MIAPGRGRPRVRRWGFADVSGPSMVPTLRDGDRVLVRYGARPRPGDLVLAHRPDRRGTVVVKRAARRVAGGWWLLGDNPYAQGDSRLFGVVPDDLVVARVVRVRRSGRWGRPLGPPPRSDDGL